MLFNERKMQALQIFSEHRELRPREWAVEAGFFPLRASFSYLLHLHRMGLLRRRRDWKGRIVYQLAPHGARWLLKRRQAQHQSDIHTRSLALA
jgi:hypothetical protein